MFVNKAVVLALSLVGYASARPLPNQQGKREVPQGKGYRFIF